jgi:prepilin-type N-terminal cleavage/methylation domain-containing protein
VKLSAQKSGFTLVELVVVIALLAILSFMAVTYYSGITETARDAKRKADIDALTKTLEIYYSANKHYPVANSTGTDPLGNPVQFSGSTDGVTPWIPALANTISPFPYDPLNAAGAAGSLTNQAYYYLPGGTDCTKPSSFIVIAFMESPKYVNNSSINFQTCNSTVETIMGSNIHFRQSVQ